MKENTPLLLGCIADDFTGASDAASFLVNSGIPTILFNGIPEDAAVLQGNAAAVIALKTRSIPADAAVRDTLAAALFLRQSNVRQLYLKYCSTFDSTRAGNIGPTTDALLEFCGAPYTLLCPSLPVNGRQVRGGHLYVDGAPLHEGHMKNHPLNPMWDSYIPTLMQEQGKYPGLVLGAAALAGPDAQIEAQIRTFSENYPHFYIIPDYETESQGARIIALFGKNPLLTGGSGLLAHLAAQYKTQYDIGSGGIPASASPGKSILLSGSCSKATRAQIRHYRDSGGSALAVEPAKLLDGSLDIAQLWAFAQAHEAPLLYSADSGPAGNTQAAAHALEQAMAALGRRALEAGYTRIIVAGGETSGAVTLALGFRSFLVGESIAPGVPVLVPAENRSIRLVLKSGNFGQAAFFRLALEKTGGG